MLYNKHENLLHLAIEKTKKHETQLKTNYSLCAILCIGKNKYIGYNKKKTHPLQKEFGRNKHCVHLHAEIDAIRQAYSSEGYLGDATLYVARTTANGKIANAQPCEGCQKAIKHFSISKVYFTTSNNYGVLQ